MTCRMMSPTVQTATLAATLISDTRTSCRRASQQGPFSRKGKISRLLRWRRTKSYCPTYRTVFQCVPLESFDQVFECVLDVSGDR
jgi:hypothetical protein